MPCFSTQHTNLC